MPYVIKSKRPMLNNIVALMIKEDIKADGDLNYLLYLFCKKYVKPSYNNYKNFLGELQVAEMSAEIRSRLLAPYEDKKIEENGDV